MVTVAVMVLPEAMRAAAEAAVAAVYPTCEGSVFTCPLSADGTAPASHWLASPIASEAVMAAIQAMASQEPFASNAHLRTCEPMTTGVVIRSLLAELGLQIVEVSDE